MATRRTIQPSLFDAKPTRRPMPPHVLSATSQAAAETVQPKAERQSIRVLEFIRSQGRRGATRHEIADGLNIPLSSVCARVGEVGGLMKTGMVAEQGTRVGPYGQPVAVLISAAQQSPVERRN